MRNVLCSSRVVDDEDPMLMFEYANLGPRFTLTRLAMDLVGIAGIAWLMDRLLGTRDREEIRAKTRPPEVQVRP